MRQISRYPEISYFTISNDGQLLNENRYKTIRWAYDCVFSSISQFILRIRESKFLAPDFSVLPFENGSK